ncbi:hypothetical protein B6D19_10075 [Gilliamella apicola]|uniref:P63C domain-containing protein n=1 Tax=Gilliamella apicola TaxID=1196095 RepID=UPI000A359725|nr:P63C domain-containing protein [Gilliamella apicola]OTQ31036.1 hypothetical protein B6D19_10075 [Gilliamella apicola]OTQ40290.1 hypothetical protein B6D20_10100 [Gilliamella apicola]
MNNKRNGGFARAKALTAEQRSEIGKKGARKREENKALPIATHIGELIIGETILDVSVLNDGRRIISQASVFKALDRPQRGIRTKGESDQDIMPAFMDAKNLVPFISTELKGLITKVRYRNKNKQIQEGFEASILPLVCDLYLKARDANALLKSQIDTAFKAEILVRSLARVGIIALVDEATGYQKDRAKNALAEILEKFVAKELQPWVKTFPTEYYEQLFRVWKQKFPPENINKRPGFMGTVTNNIIYSRLAPNLLEELKKAETKSERKAKLHQFLTDDIGHPKLREHLSSIITLLKISKDKNQFLSLVDQVHPKYNTNYEIDFDKI